MLDEMTFQVTNNKLEKTNSICNTLYASNQYYDIIIFYNGGTYIQDKQYNNIKRENITIKCIEKGDTLSMTYCNGSIFIQDAELTMIPIREIDSLTKRMKIAEQSAKELLKLIDDYF